MESRLKQIRKGLGLTQEEMAENLGCSKSNISMIETGKSILTEKNKRWLIQSLNINPEFIKTGKGVLTSPRTGGGSGKADENRVPLYDLMGVKRLEQLFEPGGGITPQDHICIPNLPKCDGAIYYIGDAMYPIIRSGDMVLYRTLSDVSEIFWGDMYLVSVETSAGEYISVCYLDKSDTPGIVVMRGADSDRSTEVDIRKIRAIAFVKATIRMNSSK